MVVMKQNSQVAIARLLADRDFNRIPAVANQFNIFDAVGMASQEIRHSTFLAFLLSPREAHGLGDIFLRAFLQALFVGSDGDLTMAGCWFLNDARVDREWNHIDILVRLPKEQVALVIENKVWSGEHSDQLNRYYQIVKTHHPGWRIVPVYLTPGGSMPSDDRYKALRYSTIIEIIERLLLISGSLNSNPDSQVLLRHYVQLIRKNIVGDSELEKLCQKVYLENREAIDLILKYRPDTQNDLRGLLEELVTETQEVFALMPTKKQVESNFKKYCVFLPNVWDELVPQTASGSDNWTDRICNFVIVNLPAEMHILLQLRPGSEEDRQRFYGIAQSAGLIPAGLRMKSYPELRRWDLLTPADYRTTTPSALHEIVRAGWSNFVSEELPRITEIFQRGLRRT